LTRISRGGDGEVLPNEIYDTLTVYRYNQPPVAPVPGASSSEGVVTLSRDTFTDPDSHGYGATRWQVASSCASFGSPVVDVWRQSENIYFDVDTLQGIDHSELEVDSLTAGTTYCMRVRVRDAALAWSEWSLPASFTTSGNGPTPPTDNLIVNGDAEAGECDSVAPYSGAKAFAVGGVCGDESATGEAVQVVDVAFASADIDVGSATLNLSAFLRNWGGSDRPSFRAIFRDQAGNELDRSPIQQGVSSVWTEHSIVRAVPVSTRSIDIVLVGTRNSGSDNDSYFDEIAASLSFVVSGCRPDPDTMNRLGPPNRCCILTDTERSSWTRSCV